MRYIVRQIPKPYRWAVIDTETQEVIKEFPPGLEGKMEAFDEANRLNEPANHI